MKTSEQALGDERISLLLDAVAGDVVTELSSWLVDGGTLVSYGGMSGDPVVVSPPDLIFRDIHLRAFWLKHWLETTPRSEIGRLYPARLPRRRRRPAGPVAATYPLEQYRDAVAHAVQTGRADEVLFAW